jgi:RimJ/RimL family protein N-acetyltransferase
MDAIVSEKLTLKPFEANHIDGFVEAVRESHRTVGLWMPWCREKYSREEAKTWFDRCQLNVSNKSAYDIGVFLTESDLLIGGISINQIDHQNRIGNIGYWVRESQQNQGLVSKAVKLIAEFGWKQLKLVRLELVILEDNAASRRVAEKCGAKFECIAANRLINNGKPMPAAVYSLLP